MVFSFDKLKLVNVNVIEFVKLVNIIFFEEKKLSIFNEWLLNLSVVKN